MTLVHASTVAIDGRAVVIRGAAGSGKSDLALRLIDEGAMLVADDQTEIRSDGTALTARAPKTILGQIEVRGLGVVTLPAVEDAPVVLVVDLVPSELVERLPVSATETILGIELPLLLMAPFQASATAKLRLALAAAQGKATVIRD